ncbi:hypothetical protein ACK6ST_04590 [Proteus terrae]|uniref:hypothetical protein n=1 Tax=Proteus terrae TaxID=1574161 RepID=UPI003C2D2FE1
MLFGDTVVVKDRDGYSTEGYPSSERSHPEYERKMAVIRAYSNEINAITTHEIATRDSFKTPKKGDINYYSSLFETSRSTTRIITMLVDAESLSDHIRCISKYTRNLLSVKPTYIEVTIREVSDEKNHDIFGSSFYFMDKRDRRPSLFGERNDSLSINVYLNKLNFSKIFNEIKSGSESASITFQFIAYSDGMEWFGKNIYLINPDDESSENFVMLTSISLSRLSLSKDENNDNHLDDSKEIDLDDTPEDKKEVMLSEILTSLNSLSNTVKGGFYILCAFAVFLVFFAFR